MTGNSSVGQGSAAPSTSAWSDVSGFLSQPFSTGGGAVQWFAFVGLILVSLWLWHAIARDFMRVVDAA